MQPNFDHFCFCLHVSNLLQSFFVLLAYIFLQKIESPLILSRAEQTRYVNISPWVIDWVIR